MDIEILPGIPVIPPSTFRLEVTRGELEAIQYGFFLVFRERDENYVAGDGEVIHIGEMLDRIKKARMRAALNK